MSKDAYIKIVNFMKQGAEVLLLVCGHIDHLIKKHYFPQGFFFIPELRADKRVESNYDQEKLYQFNVGISVNLIKIKGEKCFCN